MREYGIKFLWHHTFPLASAGSHHTYDVRERVSVHLHADTLVTVNTIRLQSVRSVQHDVASLFPASVDVAHRRLVRVMPDQPKRRSVVAPRRPIGRAQRCELPRRWRMFNQRYYRLVAQSRGRIKSPPARMQTSNPILVFHEALSIRARIGNEHYCCEDDDAKALSRRHCNSCNATTPCLRNFIFPGTKRRQCSTVAGLTILQDFSSR